VTNPNARPPSARIRLATDAAAAHADEHALVRLVLSPSPQSVPLYIRAGFEPATSLLLRPLP